MEQFPEVLTVEQAAKYIQVSRPTMDKLIENKTVKAVDITPNGKRRNLRIRKKDLDNIFNAGGEKENVKVDL